MERNHLLNHLSDYLQVERWPDMGVNGLQVEGCSEINKIAAGVSASVALISDALQWGADAILVHHGILWEKLDPVIRGSLKRRLALLLGNDLNLLAYHLPLDGHPEVGNNAQIARRLGLTQLTPAFPYRGSLP